MAPKRTTTRPRDKDATRRDLIAAVGRVIARDGFHKAGVNAVAREAGVDKVLIYRYFGDLEGLMDAFGREGDFWPSLEELAGGDVAAFRALSPRQRMTTLMANLAEGLRARPVTLEILAWETMERNALTARLEELRERWSDDIRELMSDLTRTVPGSGTEAGPRTGADWFSVGVLLSAALQYLAIRSRRIRLYGGLDIGSDDGWRQIASVIDGLAARLFEPSAP
jgi:AcrR family transcriptional regulator